MVSSSIYLNLRYLILNMCNPRFPICEEHLVSSSITSFVGKSSLMPAIACEVCSIGFACCNLTPRPKFATRLVGISCVSARVYSCIVAGLSPPILIHSQRAGNLTASCEHANLVDEIKSRDGKNSRALSGKCNPRSKTTAQWSSLVVSSKIWQHRRRAMKIISLTLSP